jgi:hypothetical protein
MNQQEIENFIFSAKVEDNQNRACTIKHFYGRDCSKLERLSLPTMSNIFRQGGSLPEWCRLGESIASVMILVLVTNMRLGLN